MNNQNYEGLDLAIISIENFLKQINYAIANNYTLEDFKIKEEEILSKLIELRNK